MNSFLTAIERGMWRGIVALAATGAVVLVLDKFWGGPR